MTHRAWRPTTLDVHGHRGARGLAPESTYASFAAALAAGVTGVELDVRLTADGHVVVWHDPTLEPRKCLFTGADLAGAPVGELTLDQLATVDIGSRTLTAYPQQQASPGARILTLTQLLEAFVPDHPDLWWTVEVKCDPTDPREVATRRELTEKVVTAINTGGIADRAFVHSFDWAVLALAEEADPTLLRSATVEGDTWFDGSPWLAEVSYAACSGDLPAAALAAGAQVLSPWYQWCTADSVAHAHDLGLGVLPWTVNEPEDLRAVIATGVDGLVTDYPDRLPLS